MTARLPDRTPVPRPSDGSGFIYMSVRNLLAAKIRAHEIAPGTVLKEAPVSAQLGVSRAPVRRAMEMLAEEGLIHAASGQGYVVGAVGAAPVRLSVRRLSEVLTEHPGSIDRSATWERIFEQVRDEVTACMPFGTYRIQETELGDHHHVSRTVAREVLWRLMDRRLIEKNRKSHWIVGQMTARDLRETLELRRLLEPQALAHSAARMDRGAIDALSGRIETAIAGFSACAPAEINEIETQMFRLMSDGVPNARLLASIRRNQISLVVPRLFRQHFPMIDDLPLLHDYGQILYHLRTGAVDVAQVLLRNHLLRVEALILSRLRVLSVLPSPRHAAYLSAVNQGTKQ